MAIGIWAATAGLGVALGPVVGGFLLDHFWWGSIFIVNVPLCALAIVVGRAAPPRVARPGRAGASTGRAPRCPAPAWSPSCGRSSRRPREGWTSAAGARRRRRSPRSRSARSSLQQRRAAEPLLDLRLFRNPRFTAASAHRSWCCSSPSSGSCSSSTQYLQFVLGYSPSAAGVRVLPYAGRDDRVRAALVEARRALRHQARRDRRDAAVRGRPRGRGDGHDRHGLRPARASRSCSWAPAWGSRARRRPSRSWARCRPSGRTSARRSTTRPASSAARSASPIVGSIMSSLYATQLGAAARRRAGARRRDRPRVARGRGGARRGRRGPGPRRVRPCDVAGVGPRRGGGRARRRDRLAPPAGPRRRPARGRDARNGPGGARA